MAHHRTAVLILVCALYVAARAWRLTDSCLWFDEIFSIHAAEHPWNQLFWFVAQDLIHPPLFYIRLKLWIAVVGDSLYWLRMLPVIISVVAIAPFLLLCRELKLDRATTALAFFLLAVNGSLIKYSQEVRMYSLLLCLSLVSMWLFARYFHRGKSLVPLIIVNVLMVYTHYFGWLVLASEVALIACFQRIKWRRMAAMTAVVFAAFLPWIIAVFSAARAGSDLGQNIGWMTRPGPREIGVFIFDLIEPFYYQASSAEPSSIFRVSVPILLICLAAGATWLARWKDRTADERNTLYLLSILAGLPAAAAFVASWLFPYSIWGTRHLVIVFAPLTILIAIAVTRLPTNWMRTAVITLTILFCAYSFALQGLRPTPVYSWCTWAELSADTRADAPIYATEELIAYHIWFANRRDAARSSVIKIDNVHGVGEDRAFFLPRGFDGVGRRDVAQIDETRFWFAYRTGPSENEAAMRDFLDKGYRISARRTAGTLEDTSVIVLLER